MMSRYHELESKTLISIDRIIALLPTAVLLDTGGEMLNLAITKVDHGELKTELSRGVTRVS